MQTLSLCGPVLVCTLGAGLGRRVFPMIKWALSLETNMKKLTIALAVVSATGAAFAQSSVTISGGVSAAYERTTAKGDDAGITGYDASSNNITFRGTEDLGGGLKAEFVLNSRFNTASGSLGSAALTSGGTDYRLFENAFIALSGGFGQLGVGRNQPISVAAFDAFGGLGTNFNNKNAAITTTDYAYNNVAASRHDKIIWYTTPNFNGFTGTVAHTFNPTVNTDREVTLARAAYAKGPLSVAYVVERNPAKMGDTLRKDQNLGASYDFGVAKALLLWGQEGSAKSRMSIGTHVPVGSNIKLMGSYRTEGETVSSKGVVSKLPAGWALGAEYALSKRTTMFAHHGDNDVSAQSAYRIGIRHTF